MKRIDLGLGAGILAGTLVLAGKDAHADRHGSRGVLR